MTDRDRTADVVARLRRALRRAARAAQPTQTLSVAQFELLQLLADTPGVRAGEVATGLRLAPTTVSTLLGRLLEAKVVARRADPDDRRAYRLELTAAGRRQLAAWQAVHADLLADALGRLGAADRRAVERALPALDRLTDELERAADS